jgi:hypothetical protein
MPRSIACLAISGPPIVVAVTPSSAAIAVSARSLCGQV